MLSLRPSWTALLLLVAAMPACFQSVVFDRAEGASASPDLGAPVVDAAPPDAGPDPCSGPPNLAIVDPAPGEAAGSVDPLLAVFDRCMTRAGSLVLEPAGITLRASAPETEVSDAQDLGERFIDEEIGRDAFLDNPACYRSVGFRLFPSVVIPPGMYQVRFDDGWVSCEGRRFDAERDPLAATWSFVVEP